MIFVNVKNSRGDKRSNAYHAELPKVLSVGYRWAVPLSAGTSRRRRNTPTSCVIFLPQFHCEGLATTILEVQRLNLQRLTMVVAKSAGSRKLAPKL